MNGLFIAELVLVAVACIALAFGVLVFRGDPKRLGRVADGRDFLGSGPRQNGPRQKP